MGLAMLCSERKAICSINQEKKKQKQNGKEGKGRRGKHNMFEILDEKL